MLSRHAVPALLAISALTACGRQAVLAVEAPGPARSAEAVELLLDAPDRPYRTVALIRSTERSLLNDLEQLKREVREAAAGLGADAVILGFSGSETSGGTGLDTHGNVVIGHDSDSLRVVGRAIVYTDR